MRRAGPNETERERARGVAHDKALPVKLRVGLPRQTRVAGSGGRAWPSRIAGSGEAPGFVRVEIYKTKGLAAAWGPSEKRILDRPLPPENRNQNAERRPLSSTKFFIAAASTAPSAKLGAMHDVIEGPHADMSSPGGGCSKPRRAFKLKRNVPNPNGLSVQPATVRPSRQ
jgi:hypothetical protein